MGGGFKTRRLKPLKSSIDLQERVLLEKLSIKDNIDKMNNFVKEAISQSNK